VATAGVRSFWKSITATLGHRHRLIRDTAHIVLGRLTTERIEDPDNEDVVTAITADTQEVIRGFEQLVRLAKEFAGSVHNEYESFLDG
ncbi:hypothetical protein PENTCL1PPCAC_9158, partial [Pristionchus entomophagus]